MDIPHGDTPHGAAPGRQARDDARQLAALGYRQELRRSLGLFSTFAMPFSYISASVGIFLLFGLGIGTGGPAFIWSWPLVAVGQFLVALVFAELASHYPLAGSLYQWGRRLASPSLAWFSGWIYLVATILTATGVAFTMPGVLDALFNWPVTPGNQVLITVATLGLAMVINIVGVRVMAALNNAGVAAEIIATIGFSIALFIFGRHQSPGIVFSTAGTEHTPGAGGGYLGVFALAMFMSLWVIYGFDAAGTVGEETVNPSKRAPLGMLGAVVITFVGGSLFLLANLLAIKDVPAVMKSATPLLDIMTGALGRDAATLYLVVVGVATFAATLAIQATGNRLVYAMGRDDQLPFSGLWRTVHPTFHTPVWAALAVGLLSMLPLVVSQQVGVVTTGATGMIYLAYFLTCVVVLVARLRGWPRQRAWFSLGRWATLVNVLAILWPGAMLVNFAWPRAATNPALGSGGGFPALANAPVIGGAPIYELTVAVVLATGAAYWLLVQRHRVPVRAAEPEQAAPSGTGSATMTPAR